jgi:hypothetical protein
MNNDGTLHTIALAYSEKQGMDRMTSVPGRVYLRPILGDPRVVQVSVAHDSHTTHVTLKLIHEYTGPIDTLSYSYSDDAEEEQLTEPIDHFLATYFLK